MLFYNMVQFDLYSDAAEAVCDAHTHTRLYFIAVWVTKQAVTLFSVDKTVRRCLDELRVCMLHFYLQ